MDKSEFIKRIRHIGQVCYHHGVVYRDNIDNMNEIIDKLGLELWLLMEGEEDEN